MTSWLEEKERERVEAARRNNPALNNLAQRNQFYYMVGGAWVNKENSTPIWGVFESGGKWYCNRPGATLKPKLP